MKLQEQIYRIQSMMELNESFTGDTPTDLKQYFINKPVKLIGDLNTDKTGLTFTLQKKEKAEKAEKVVKEPKEPKTPKEPKAE